MYIILAKVHMRAISNGGRKYDLKSLSKIHSLGRNGQTRHKPTFPDLQAIQSLLPPSLITKHLAVNPVEIPRGWAQFLKFSTHCAVDLTPDTHFNP